jgi:glucose dehydrogenase/uncharacterized cupredoxin-like copper-binding protein
MPTMANTTHTMQETEAVRASRRDILIGSAALALGAAGVPVLGRSARAQEATPATVEAVPPAVAEHRADWPLPNRDYANTRATTDATITSENVDELGTAWTFPIPGTGPYGAFASNPIVIGETVFAQDLASNVFALNLETGEVIWERRYDNAVVGPNGPAVGWGKLFATVNARDVAALDLETGEELWRTQLDGATGSIQPTVYGGHVYVSTLAGAVDVEGEGEDEEFAVRGYEGGHSGLAYALDQGTGEVIWWFQTVQEGFWGSPEINSGAGLWFPPAIDRERDTVYYGTGNPAPFPGIIGWPNASSRPGPNLYSSSLIALDRQGGELQWYYQAKPHDLFDLDFHLSPMLTTVEIDGQARDLVIGSGKLGRIVALDRESGEVLWDTAVGEHQNDELNGVPPGETIEVLPGVLGGVETPMAFADGVVYAAIVNMATPYTATGHGAVDGTQAVQNAERMTDLDAGTGEIVAIDSATGEILWSTAVERPPFGGVTVVNDLVVASTFDGAIFALERERGEEAWRSQLAAPLIAWPAVAGDTLIVGSGAGDNATLTAFRLGAEAAATPVASPEGTPAAAADAVQVTLTEFAIDMPKELPAGSTTFEVSNAGTIEHNFEVEGQGIEREFEQNLQPGETKTLQVDLQPGTYEVYCPVGNHAEQGMRLELTVTG